MAAAAAMSAAGCAGAGASRSLSRFRGCLAGALLGDCVGAVYEAHDTVPLTSVLRHVQSLEPEPGSSGSARTGGRGGRTCGADGRGRGVGGTCCTGADLVTLRSSSQARPSSGHGHPASLLCGLCRWGRHTLGILR